MEKVSIKEVVNSAIYFKDRMIRRTEKDHLVGHLVSYDPGENSCG